jgi:hypothetical protein
LLSSCDTSAISDGNLWDFDLDPSGDLVGAVKSNGLDFDQSTIIAMVDEYRELLRASLIVAPTGSAVTKPAAASAPVIAIMPAVIHPLGAVSAPRRTA